MSEEPESPAPEYLFTVGELALRWDGFSYVAPDGRTWWSGAAEPSNEDATDALASPRTPPAPVPEAVTPWQIRRALNAAGLRATVEAAVDAADQETRDAWEFASQIRRDNALLAGMAAQLGLSSAQVDDLFRQAASFS